MDGPRPRLAAIERIDVVAPFAQLSQSLRPRRVAIRDVVDIAAE
jgi:hypothetical protein